MGSNWIDFCSTLMWALAASITMGLSLRLFIFLWDKLTPDLDEFGELAKGNIAVAIVIAALILGFSLVTSVLLLPGSH